MTRPLCRSGRLLVWMSAVAVSVGCRPDGPRLDADGPPRWSLEPELRIGPADHPQLAFTRVGALEVGPDGTIFSLHPDEGVIRRWGAEGTPAGTVGQTGDGPGELRHPQSMGWRADTLWVMEAGTFRVSFFDSRGRFIRDDAPRIELGSGGTGGRRGRRPWPVALLEDGSLYGVTPALSQEVATGVLTEIAHVRMGPEPGVSDTLALLPTGVESVLGIVVGQGGAFLPQPFADGILTTMAKDGSALVVVERTAAAGPDARYVVTRIELDGDTAYSRPFAYDPVPIPEQRLDSTVEALSSDLYDRVGERMDLSPDGFAERVRNALHTPRYHPPVRNVFSGRDETTWLGVGLPGPDGNTWRVLGGAGDPIGTVVLPRGLRVMAGSRDAVWGIERDARGVEYIVRHAVVAP